MTDEPPLLSGWDEFLRTMQGAGGSAPPPAPTGPDIAVDGQPPGDGGRGLRSDQVIASVGTTAGLGFILSGWGLTGRTLALTLFIVALVLQLVGAALVSVDVYQTIRNTRQLKADLAAAEDTAQDHHRAMEEGPEIVRRFRDALGQRQVDQIVRQLGPTSLRQREALVRHVNAQNEISDFRRWGGFAILVLGVVIGFVGNAVSLYV